MRWKLNPEVTVREGGRTAKRACCRGQEMFRFDFIADEFGQARVVRFQALEEKQERIVPAPFEFVADSADLLQVAECVGGENPCAFTPRLANERSEYATKRLVRCD